METGKKAEIAEPVSRSVRGVLKARQDSKGDVYLTWAASHRTDTPVIPLDSIRDYREEPAGGTGAERRQPVRLLLRVGNEEWAEIYRDSYAGLVREVKHGPKFRTVGADGRERLGWPGIRKCEKATRFFGRRTGRAMRSRGRNASPRGAWPIRRTTREQRRMRAETGTTFRELLWAATGGKPFARWDRWTRCVGCNEPFECAPGQEVCDECAGEYDWAFAFCRSCRGCCLEIPRVGCETHGEHWGHPDEASADAWRATVGVFLGREFIQEPNPRLCRKCKRIFEAEEGESLCEECTYKSGGFK